MIPKVIHYCWFGGKALPKDVRKCIRSWKEKCPDYEIVQWNESNFDIHCHPFVESAYKEKAWAFVSDYARLKIIYDRGGIYLDTDVELLKSLDFLLKYQGYIGVQQGGRLCNTGLGFGTVKLNSVVQDMMKSYDGLTYIPEQKNELACPKLNDKVFRNLGYQFHNEIQEIGDIVIFPPRYFDPYAPGRAENLMCNDTVSIHHYTASWTCRKQRIKRKIVRIVGDERVRKIKEYWGR